MIYLGRRVTDCIKLFQDKTLAIICPLADSAALNKRWVYILVNNMSVTYQFIPLLDIIDRMDTGIKIPHDDENLNPEQQVCCKEPINCLSYLLSIRATTGTLHKVFCPELASILVRTCYFSTFISTNFTLFPWTFPPSPHQRLSYDLTISPFTNKAGLL